MAYEDLYGSPVSTTDDWANNPWINNMATRGVMSGLQWLGETLGKPQRALFGTLAGDPTALANLIPFSDTLGITDPSKAVTGRDLLRKAGVVDQQDNWGNFAGGLALDIAADPLAWVRGPLGALTKTGEAAAKAGTLERSLAKRIRGTPGMASAAVEDATLGSNLLSHQMPVSDALVPRAEGAIGSVIPQMASGVAESSLGQSGKLMPQGGWFSITDRPWYVEPFMGKADNVYIGGTGKIGQGAADLVDKGWDKATRARIPGTDFSPVAWLRSAFEPGAANVTAHPELTTHLGESVVPETNAYKAASGNLASPMYGSHSETINELMKLGMAHEDAAKAMSWAGRSTRELGEMRLPSGVQLPDNAAQVLERYGNDYAKRIETLTDTVRDPYLKVGGELPEAKSMWGHPYAPRTMADTGIKRTQQQMERSDLLSKLPGGAVMAEAFTTDPVISGILNRKTAGASAGTRDLGPSIHQWGGKPITVDQAEALIKKRGIDYADAIEAEAQKQLAKNYLPVQAVPEEALKLASKGGAAELGQEMARYVAGLPKEVAERGYFYNLDLATGARNYGTNIAPQTAVRSGVLNAMAKEAKDYVKLADKTDDLTKIMSLDKVLEHAGMKSGADELAKRMGLEKTSDLSKYGLDKKFADAIKKEIEGPSAAKPSVLRTLTDAFRYGVTVPWPANFVRNYTGEITNQGIAGTGAAKNLGGAVKFLSGQLAEGTPEYAKFQQAYQHGVAHGLLESGQTRQLTGTGVTHSGNLLINTMPPQRAANAAEVLQNWAKPMVSETAREDLGITPFRELMGYPKNAPSATSTAAKPNPYAAGVATDAPRIGREQTALATTSQRPHANQGGWSAETKATTATSRGPVETLVDYAGKVIDPARGYLGAMEVAHEFQNNATRLQQFVNLIDEGYTPASAAQRVKVLQRDYEATTPFMQNNVKNMVPFAAFSAQNLKTQADLLSSNTGRYSAMAKLLNSGRSGGSFVPGYASSGAAIEIPGAPDGKQRYLGSLGLTVEDEAISALASLLSGRGEEAVRKVATSSNPALKSMYEIATGRQVFSGRNLDDLAPSPVFSSVLGDSGAARMASELTSGTPLARAMSTVDRLAASPEKGVMSTLLNLGTGIRTVDVDKQQAAQIAARDTIQKLLNASDQYKTRESIVIDPKWRGREDEIPPEIQALMKEYLYLQKRAADAVKAKRASGN